MSGAFPNLNIVVLRPGIVVSNSKRISANEDDLDALFDEIQNSKHKMPKGIVQIMPQYAPTTELHLLASRIVFEATNLDQVEFKIVTYEDL